MLSNSCDSVSISGLTEKKRYFLSSLKNLVGGNRAGEAGRSGRNESRWVINMIVDLSPDYPNCVHFTMVQNSQKSRLEYWATRSSVRSFARTAHAFACSRLRTPHRSRPPLRSLVRSLAHLAHSLARGKVNFWCLKMTWFCPIVGGGEGINGLGDR